MVRIESVTDQSSPLWRDAARALFRSYADFLRASSGNAFLCFSGLENEIQSLPAPYAGQGGEVLVALEDPDIPLGCIAYRALPSATDPAACEIKRLFVSPSARGQSLGRRLILTALNRARDRGFQTACLDTEPQSMITAKNLYLDLGFLPDHERAARSDNRVVYFKKSLVT